MINRRKSKQISIGNVKIGGNAPISVQSMCNTDTRDIEKTLQQITELASAGCEIARLAVLNPNAAEAIKDIVKKSPIPLVADIHFDYRLALQCIENGIHALRINPGNITNQDKVHLICKAAKEKHIPIRIGVNSGSLPSDLTPTAHNMIEAAKRHIKILEDNDFYDIVLSLKASNVKLMVEAYLLASETFPYPLHVGLTEAGTNYGGLIKGSIGIGTLLLQGIANTIRVSLTANPIEEIKAAKHILNNCGLYDNLAELTSCPTCGRIQYDMMPIAKEIEEFLTGINKNIKVAIMGCAVNGPGEAKGADIAICGGVNEALLFLNGVAVRKIPYDNIIEELKQEILKF